MMTIMRLPERIVSYDPPRKSTLLWLMLCLLFVGCGSHRSHSAPKITFIHLPAAGPGDPEELLPISGTVTGARPGQQIVIYSLSQIWWVQPTTQNPFTPIGPDGHWETSIHPGTNYAALVVDHGYMPPFKSEALPAVGPGVATVAIIGTVQLAAEHPSRIVHFSGYDWYARSMSSPRNGRRNHYDPQNAFVDDKGALHLRIVNRAGVWTCTELSLARGFGYGTYIFDVRDISHFDPLTVLGMFTWDEADTTPSHREMDVEISRWGKPANKNAQFVVQPFYMSENTARFIAPGGPVRFSFRWQPGRISFLAQRITGPDAKVAPIAEHVFTSGVPSAGAETVHLNLSITGGVDASRTPSEAEAVIDRFEYLP